MKELTTRICEAIEKNESIVLASIVSRAGSAPRTAGTHMLIDREGKGIGTIGGGLLEHKSMIKAVELFETGTSYLLPFDLTHMDVAGMDMICGGEVEVLLDLVRPTPENREVFARYRLALENGEKALLLTVVRQETEQRLQTDHCFISRSGEATAPLPLPAETLNELLSGSQAFSIQQVLSQQDILLVTTPTAQPKTVYIFGGGHVSLPTGYFASKVGFDVVVLDDREAFASPRRFPFARKVKVVPDFNTAFSDLPVDEDAFVVIVTRGHLHDKTVLAQALGTQAAYIGMIGSRGKRNKIYRALLDQGFTEEDLARVHAPIGIEIQAETPEEIAISIVAELIDERAKLSP
jgi:xanthine dehydrogenase accessory factor